MSKSIDLKRIIWTPLTGGWLILAYCVLWIFLTILVSRLAVELEAQSRLIVSSIVSFFIVIPLFAYSLFRAHREDIPPLYDTDKAVNYLKEKYKMMDKSERSLFIFWLIFMMVFIFFSIYIPVLIDRYSYPAGLLLFLPDLIYISLTIFLVACSRRPS